MIEKILNNKWIRIIIITLIYVLLLYETGAKVYNTYSWLLYIFVLLSLNKIEFYNKEHFKTSVILSFVYSILEVFGKTFYTHMFDYNGYIDTNIFTIKKFVLLLLTWLFIYIIVTNLFTVFNKYKTFEKRNKYSTKKVFLVTTIIAIISRIPYLLALYPGCLSADSIEEFKMIMTPNAVLSNHHPLIHVLFMYIPYNIGNMLFHNPNAAVATVSFTQIIVTSLIIGYIVSFLYKRDVKKSYLILTVLFYTLLPVHSYYSITMWKDIIFSYLIVILTIKIYYLYKDYYDNNKVSNKDLLFFAIISFLCVMFRNNAIYAYVFLIVIMSLCFKKELKKILITTSSVVVIYLIIMIPIYNAIGVEKSASSEYIAIPLQQVGRMAYKNVPFTKEETKIINKLIDIKELKRIYIPQNVDYIKFDDDYHKEVFDKHKDKYFMTWLKLVIKHPRDAIESYAISTLGYWYPGVRVWTTSRNVFKNELNLYQDSKGIKKINKIILADDNYDKDKPIYNIFLSIGAGFWIFLFLLVYSMKKKKEKIVFFAPILGMWLTMMIASPVYGEYRYVYSVFLSLPILGLVPYIETKDNNKKNSLLKNKLMQQILKFGVVGGLAFVIDYLTLIICKEFFGLNVLLSAAIAFTVSVVINYILSIKWVFDVDKNKSKKRNFVLFIIFSIIGLILTEIIMWLGTDIMNIHYLIVKIIATAIVMVFNFITRKMFLEK